MLSFKEYLQEETNSMILQNHLAKKYPIAYKGFSINNIHLPSEYLKYDRWNEEYFAQKFQDDLIKRLKINNINVRIDSREEEDIHQIGIYYAITDDVKGTFGAINEFMDFSIELASKQFEHSIIDRFPGSVWINAPLTVKVEFPEVNLDFSGNDDVSLSGIDKFLNCEFILLQSGDKVTSSVLSLLKIKKLKKIVDIANNPEWVAIVNRHVQTDKDILDCQEELISKGLKDYAKL